MLYLFKVFKNFLTQIQRYKTVSQKLMSYHGTKNKALFAHGILVDRIKLECGYKRPNEVLYAMTGIFIRTEIQRQIWTHKESHVKIKVEILMIKL